MEYVRAHDVKNVFNFNAGNFLAFQQTLRGLTHLKGKKEANSIIFSDETNKDINDWYFLVV